MAGWRMETEKNFERMDCKTVIGDVLMENVFQYEFQKNLIYNNPEKQKIARGMLERYTGATLDDFQKYIILTNFHRYLEEFSERCKDEIHEGSVMQVVHEPGVGVSMVDFKIGAPTAALIIEILSVLEPEAVLFLGMCGGLHRSLKVGDFILPMAAIRDEGVSHHFIPPQVPSLPTFKIQKFISQIIVEKGLDYRTGVVHTTDYRFWEFDKIFKNSFMRSVPLPLIWNVRHYSLLVL